MTFKIRKRSVKSGFVSGRVETSVCVVVVFGAGAGAGGGGVGSGKGDDIDSPGGAGVLVMESIRK